MSNETLTLNTELKPISSGAGRLLGATVRFKGEQRAYKVRGGEVRCVCWCVCVCSCLFVWGTIKQNAWNCLHYAKIQHNKDTDRFVKLHSAVASKGQFTPKSKIRIFPIFMRVAEFSTCGMLICSFQFPECGQVSHISQQQSGTWASVPISTTEMDNVTTKTLLLLALKSTQWVFSWLSVVVKVLSSPTHNGLEMFWQHFLVCMFVCLW